MENYQAHKKIRILIHKSAGAYQMFQITDGNNHGSPLYPNQYHWSEVINVTINKQTDGLDKR
ncbi:MAG: hypothetical protein Q8907_06155 [Bacteroidota bacterium]|nr:hypothetical protein [Bacteroidota bacterium]